MKETICPLCKSILKQFDDNSGAVCPKGHFVTNAGYGVNED